MSKKKKCTKCGTIYDTGWNKCVHCNHKDYIEIEVKKRKKEEPTPTVEKKGKTLCCSKCSSENISVQIVDEKATGGFGLLIWVIISFVINIIIGIFMLVLAILFFTSAKPISKKCCICQKCGHSWEIR